MPGQGRHASRDARSPARPRASSPRSALTTPAPGRALALALALGRGETNRPWRGRALPPVATPFCVALVILKTGVLVSRAAAGPNTACNRASYHKSSTGGRQQPEAGPDDQGRAKPAPGGPPAGSRTPAARAPCQLFNKFKKGLKGSRLSSSGL